MVKFWVTQIYFFCQVPIKLTLDWKAFVTYTVIFMFQGAPAPRSREVDSNLSISVDSNLTSKSVDSSLVSKTVDGRLPPKSSMDSDLNYRMALRVDYAEAGYGQNKVTDIKWYFSCHRWNWFGDIPSCDISFWNTNQGTSCPGLLDQKTLSWPRPLQTSINNIESIMVHDRPYYSSWSWGSREPQELREPQEPQELREPRETHLLHDLQIDVDRLKVKEQLTKFY